MLRLIKNKTEMKETGILKLFFKTDANNIEGLNRI